MQANVSHPSPGSQSHPAGATPTPPARLGRRRSRRSRNDRGPLGLLTHLVAGKAAVGGAQSVARQPSSATGSTRATGHSSKTSDQAFPKASKAPRRPALLARFTRAAAAIRSGPSAVAGSSPKASSQKTLPKTAPQKTAPKPKRIDVLFTGEAQTAAATAAKDQTEALLGSKLLFDLVLVRPWILVCGFWLLLVGTSAVALSGLADPGKPTVSEAPEPTVKALQPLSVAPDTAVTSRLAESPVALTGGQTATPTNDPLPMWSLWVMVGACAAGCVMLSRPELLTFGASERRRSSRTHGKSTRSTLARAVPTRGAAPQDGAATQVPSKMGRPQLKPNYPQGQVMAVSGQGSIRQVTPTRAAKPAPSQRVSFQVGQETSAQNGSSVQPQVSVIPAHESHALDWKDGSLAHKLDVRQNRSLKSFL